MAIITYDGFENYSSFDAVKSYLNYTNTGTVQIISATDANGVTPRNGGSCLKMTSSGRTFPRAYFKTPTGTHNVSGVVGFAIYPTLPAGGSFGTFTPIGANMRDDTLINFVIGINSNMNLEIRRPNFSQPEYSITSSSASVTSAYWSAAAARDYNCDKGGCYSVSYLSSMLTGPLVGTSTSVLTLNQWNYVEIKYVLRGAARYWNGTDNSPAALTQIKINRNRADNVLDMDSSALNAGAYAGGNTRGWNASQLLGENNCGKGGCNYTGANWFTSGFAFGIVQSDTARVWNTYIDDFYWTDLSGTADNDFLGRVKCSKSNYNTVSAYTYSEPGSSTTALSNISETFAGAPSMTTTSKTNQFNQTFDVRASSLASETLSPINVRQCVLGCKVDTNSTLALQSSLAGSNSTSSKVTFGTDVTNGHFQFRDYTNAPDGAEWTNQKIADTVFKHTTTTVT
jgi:hypothetical protein